jgi:hypothetical protein
MKFNLRHGAFTLILLVLGLPADAGGGGGGGGGADVSIGASSPPPQANSTTAIKLAKSNKFSFLPNNFNFIILNPLQRIHFNFLIALKKSTPKCDIYISYFNCN